jgi:UDP-N-acetylmuramyl pentapeptide phosphotransferase/UDP-N-acetylglucosamine-1-phosphate transferase
MQDFFFFSSFLILASFFLVLILTGRIRDVLLKRTILDIPNDRSSHTNPVPRGGGLALLIVLLPALIGAVIYFDVNAQHAGLIVGIFLLAIISWIDDYKHVNPAIRFFLHILAAFCGIFSFPSQETLLDKIVPFWIDRALMILAWTWFINLYNFMDGIDGITGVETISIAIGLYIFLALTGINDPFVSFLILILIGTCLGFLAHNWHPARIFLGDTGSVSLGYLVGFCLLSIAVKGHLVAALVLPLYYLADSGITLVKRILHGQKIWQAHREHFYQKAAFRAGTHSKIVIFIIAANIGLIAAAILSISQPVVGISVSILIVGILLRKMHKIAIQPQTTS